MAKISFIDSVDLIGIPTPSRINTALTPELGLQFETLRRWADNSPSSPGSLKSESDSPTQLESQVIDTLSQTVPFTPLAKRPPSPDPFVEESASVRIIEEVCTIEELAVPDRAFIEELAVPDRAPIIEELAVPDQDLLKRFLSDTMTISSGRDLLAFEVTVVDEEVIDSPKKAKIVHAPKQEWSGRVLHEAFVAHPVAAPSVASSRASTSSDSSGPEILALLQSMQGQIATISSQGAAIDSKQSVVLGKIDEVKLSLDFRIDSLDAKFLNLEVENNKLKEQLSALGLRVDAGGPGSSPEAIKKVIVEEVAKAASSIPRVAAPSAPLGHRPAPAAADMRFVSRKIFIRGWCAFGEESTSGLSQVQALHVANGLVDSLSTFMKSMLEIGDRRCVAPFFKNRQITVNISAEAPHDSAYSISRALNDHITSQALHIGGKPLYCTPDAELWKKQRNGSVFKASEVILRTFGLTGDLKLVKDWPSGSLYVSSALSGDVCVRKHLAASGWVWSRDLLKVWPNANLDTLSEAIEFKS